jgi:AhpD family alkylhydroperoxidase
MTETVISMSERSLSLLHRERPMRRSFVNRRIESRRSPSGLDSRTRQLISIGVQTANRNAAGVHFHAMRAREDGATQDEVMDAVIMNLPASGLVPMLECLQSAIDGFAERDSPHPD